MKTAEEIYHRFVRYEWEGVSDTMKKSILEAIDEALRQPDVSGSLQFSEREVDFAYLCGVFNTSGIDGLHNEIKRLKELGKEPHDIIEACRKRKVCPVCKKTFEKGWGEFCSQDCWDTDM